MGVRTLGYGGRVTLSLYRGTGGLVLPAGRTRYNTYGAAFYGGGDFTVRGDGAGYPLNPNIITTVGLSYSGGGYGFSHFNVNAANFSDQGLRGSPAIVYRDALFAVTFPDTGGYTFRYLFVPLNSQFDGSTKQLGPYSLGAPFIWNPPPLGLLPSWTFPSLGRWSIFEVAFQPGLSALALGWISQNSLGNYQMLFWSPDLLASGFVSPVFPLGPVTHGYGIWISPNYQTGVNYQIAFDTNNQQNFFSSWHMAYNPITGYGLSLDVSDQQFVFDTSSAPPNFSVNVASTQPGLRGFLMPGTAFSEPGFIFVDQQCTTYTWVAFTNPGNDPNFSLLSGTVVYPVQDSLGTIFFPDSNGDTWTSYTSTPFVFPQPNFYHYKYSTVPIPLIDPCCFMRPYRRRKVS